MQVRALKRWTQARVTRKRLRALRMPSDLKMWSPKPRGLRQRTRQSWCFLWRHKMVTNMYTVEESGHDAVAETCLRCGFIIEHCMVCGDWEPED